MIESKEWENSKVLFSLIRFSSSFLENDLVCENGIVYFILSLCSCTFSSKV